MVIFGKASSNISAGGWIVFTVALISFVIITLYKKKNLRNFAIIWIIDLFAFGAHNIESEN